MQAVASTVKIIVIFILHHSVEHGTQEIFTIYESELGTSLINILVLFLGQQSNQFVAVILSSILFFLPIFTVSSTKVLIT